MNQADWFDTTNPPTNVTDAVVQSEVKAYIAGHGVDYNAIYEVFTPSTSYSSNGSSTSCGGPSLAYCAYHSNYTDASGKRVWSTGWHPVGPMPPLRFPPTPLGTFDTPDNPANDQATRPR